MYEKFYQKLLDTGKAESKTQMEAEAIVSIVMLAINTLAEDEKPETIEDNELKKIINGLKNKKAKDLSQWRNEYIKGGGGEMEKSLKKIVMYIDKTFEVPDEWEQMKIKSTHKKGLKTKMKNKRGLFITNLISKVYERVVKKRNEKCFKLSPMQTGGIRNRSTIDNVMVLLAIIERNKYLNKSTYLTFADAEKCFDKLWLEDGIKDLWNSGMKTRDCVAIKKMNQTAKAIVETPIGKTKEIELKNIVRQGTVSGPPICGATMDCINKIGFNVVTHYGPELQIKILAFVDDLASGGSVETANKTVANCSIMEEKKKISFNTERGKSGVLVVNEKRNEIGTITAEVRKGGFQKVDEHKLLGTWMDKTGRYKINIIKMQEKVPYMISYTKGIASNKNMGRMAISARLKMMETIIIKSILHNAECYPSYTNEEIKLLEKTQGKILRDLLDVPKSTPYFPLLLETGTLTVEARIHYKKLMLYHNIINSDDERIVKKVILLQRETPRKGTWYSGIEVLLKKYDITEVVEEVEKSTWKRTVKTNIRNITENCIRGKCGTKGRTIINDEYKRSAYMNNATTEETKQIMKTRLHMMNIPCNYGHANETRCWMCGERDVQTEHYFSCTEITNIWNVKDDDMRSENIDVLFQVSKHLEGAEKRNVLYPYGKRIT